MDRSKRRYGAHPDCRSDAPYRRAWPSVARTNGPVGCRSRWCRAQHDAIRFELGTDDGKTQVRPMQNAKCKMQKCIGERQVRARVVVSLCIVHLAFCITGISLSAQQQPGMPVAMGFSSGIVASNVPPQFKDVTFAQRLGQKLPLDVRFTDETGRDVALGEYFGSRPVVLAFVYY